jgi:autotransporter-associated beta strand protein
MHVWRWNETTTATDKGREMRKKTIYTLILLFWAITTASAGPVIDVGTHYLLPNDQRAIAISVSGGDAVEALNFFIQLADGGPVNWGTAAKPKITGIDIIGPGTLFSQSNTGSEPMYLANEGDPNLIGMAVTSTQPGVQIAASGILAYVTINTAGTSSSDVPYAVSLEHVAANYNPPDGFSTDFGDGGPTINAGQIVIVDKHDMIWNKSDNGVWTEAAWTGSPPPYPNYTARAIVNTPYNVAVNNPQEADKLTLSGGGRVAIGAAGSLAVTADVDINAEGTLAMVGGAGLSAAGINLSGGRISGSGMIGPAVVLAGGTLDAPVASDILTLNKPLGGTGGLVKTGEGTVIIKGNATYAGSTLISGGLLRLEGAASGLGDISGIGGLSVGGAAPSTLTAERIFVGALTVEAGSAVTIRPLPGGPVGGDIGTAAEPSGVVSLGIAGAILGFFAGVLPRFRQFSMWGKS